MKRASAITIKKKKNFKALMDSNTTNPYHHINKKKHTRRTTCVWVCVYARNDFFLFLKNNNSNKNFLIFFLSRARISVKQQKLKFNQSKGFLKNRDKLSHTHPPLVIFPPPSPRDLRLKFKTT